MFVMNFGAGNEDPYVPPTIPNDAITSPDGFIGAGMPPLWLLNANEGAGYPFKGCELFERICSCKGCLCSVCGAKRYRRIEEAAYGVTYGPI